MIILCLKSLNTILSVFVSEKDDAKKICIIEIVLFENCI